MSPFRGTWPEYPGVDAWLPVSAVAGFAHELAAALTEDHLGHAWFRVRGTGAPGDIDIVWTAHGVLHLATIADATSSGPILLLSRRQVAIDDLFAEESG